MGMRLQPKDIHREVIRRSERDHGSEPFLYQVWLGYPHAEGSEVIGRTERLPRPRWWRAFPVTGEFPQAIRTWSNVVEWFLEVREGHLRIADECRARETGKAEPR